MEESLLGTWTSASLFLTHCSRLTLRVKEPGRMDTRKRHSTERNKEENNHHGGKKQSKDRYKGKTHAEIKEAPRS